MWCRPTPASARPNGDSAGARVIPVVAAPPLRAGRSAGVRLLLDPYAVDSGDDRSIQSAVLTVVSVKEA